MTENFRDPTGDLGGGGDDTYVGVSVRGSFLGLYDDLVVSLLVIPPHATPEAARTAMAEAVRADNITQAEQILINTGTDRAAPKT
ncbi:hypothetical protein [Streptomyces sp. B6B3]|uniref:hypothetical protein n=1 Tax=Streptomyces sp. B6B3 TaxID=3153570 RepID=UPI00325CAC80